MRNLPTQKDIKVPLFILVCKHGHVSPDLAYKNLADCYGLTKQDLKRQDQSGEPTWHNRIRWACRALREDGLISREPHGTWCLSSKTEQFIGRMLMALVS